MYLSPESFRNKTLRTVLRFHKEISRLMCICWHLSFNRHTYFCVFYITIVIDRIVYIPFYNKWAVNPTSVNMKNCQIQLSVHVKILQKNYFLEKNVARKFSFVYLCFDLWRWKSYMGWLQSIYSVPGGREVTHQTAVPAVPGRMSELGRIFKSALFFCCCLFKNIFGDKTIVCHEKLLFVYWTYCKVYDQLNG